jgi:hypothetical protein
LRMDLSAMIAANPHAENEGSKEHTTKLIFSCFAGQ